MTRLTEDGRNEGPLWAPDGRRIAFNSIQADGYHLMMKAMDGGSVERLTTRSTPVYAHSWTPDGSALAFINVSPEPGNDIWVVPLTGDRQPVPILTSRFNESHAEFSPDGRWFGVHVGRIRPAGGVRAALSR